MVAIVKDLPLDLENVPEDKIEEAKIDVGNFLIERMLDFIDQGKSPVKGEGQWQKLTKEYAEEEKGGDRTPDMFNTGGTLGSLTFQPTPTGISVGIFNEAEGEKADGHNKFTGRPNNNPRRRYIPGPDQEFRNEIMAGIRGVILEYIPRNEEEATQAEQETVITEITGFDEGVTTQPQKLTQVGLSNIFDDSTVISILLQEQKNARKNKV